MELNSIAKTHLLNSVRFAGRVAAPVTSLRGFEKRFRIPDELPARAAFLGRFATADIETDLDAVFGKLRSAFGFKRRQLSVQGPVEGSGSISTPAFEYRIDLLPDSGGNDRVIWQRSVGRIEQPQFVFCDDFKSAFGDVLGILEVELSAALDVESIIDHVEDTGSETWKLDYDRDATWCEIRVVDTGVTMRIEKDLISVAGRETLLPVELFECYWQLQEQFLETIELPD